METELFTPADIIYSYTRKQALEDGFQVQLTGELAEMARRLYKFPIYLTRSVWNLVEMATADERYCNDIPGVVWDILWMSQRRACQVDPATVRFQVTITGTGRRRLHTMIAQVGPADIDDPAPAITVMLPGEM